MQTLICPFDEIGSFIIVGTCQAPLVPPVVGGTM
jgi:hypothetical protein